MSTRDTATIESPLLRRPYDIKCYFAMGLTYTRIGGYLKSHFHDNHDNKSTARCRCTDFEINLLLLSLTLTDRRRVEPPLRLNNVFNNNK